MHDQWGSTTVLSTSTALCWCCHEAGDGSRRCYFHLLHSKQADVLIALVWVTKQGHGAVSAAGSSCPLASTVLDVRRRPSCSSWCLVGPTWHRILLEANIQSGLQKLCWTIVCSGLTAKAGSAAGLGLRQYSHQCLQLGSRRGHLPLPNPSGLRGCEWESRLSKRDP